MSPAPRLPATMRFIERDWLSANGILFDDGTRTALVDTGYVKHQDLTLAVVRRALGERPLDLLVNTHLHSDPCGGNAILQAHYGVRTLVPAASVDAVRAWDEDALTFAATGQRCARFVCDPWARAQLYPPPPTASKGGHRGLSGAQAIVVIIITTTTRSWRHRDGGMLVGIIA